MDRPTRTSVKIDAWQLLMQQHALPGPCQMHMKVQVTTNLSSKTLVNVSCHLVKFCPGLPVLADVVATCFHCSIPCTEAFGSVDVKRHLLIIGLHPVCAAVCL
jgi:hypothetical protein